MRAAPLREAWRHRWTARSADGERTVELSPNSTRFTQLRFTAQDLQGGKKLQGVEVLHSLLADHAERLLVWALGGATVKAARLAKMIPVIVLHCVKGHHEDKVEEEPAKPPRKPRKSTFQQLPR